MIYELSTDDFGPYRRYTVAHPGNSNRFSLVPGCGATLLDLCFGGVNILDGFKTPEELTLGKWGKSAILFPFPNRLRDGRYEWLGHTYQFPLNNAAMGNAIHGFTRDAAFEISRIELTEEGAEIACRLDYTGDNPAYPFPLTLEVTFSITNRSEFHIAFFVKNRAETAIPFGLGWHPYFALTDRADDHAMQLPPARQVAIDERMIPTGELLPFSAFDAETPVGDTVLDNCFKADESQSLYRMALRNGTQAMALAASRTLFPYFQAFIPPARASIALEPMTCNVNAFQNGDGLIELPPGGDWAGAVRLEYFYRS